MAVQHNTAPAARRRGLLGHYLMVVLVWNPLLCAAVTLLLGGHRSFLRAFLVSLVISLVVCTTCFLGVAAARSLEELIWRRRGRPAPAHGTGFYLVQSAALMPAGLYLGFTVVRLLFGVQVAARLGDYGSGLVFGGIIVGIFFLWETRREARDAARLAELRARELEHAALAAQLQALTSQMNPHLLFNALNTVAALIPTEPARAEETVLRLAELYRGVLTATRHASHSLASELEICRAYLDVEVARFGARLRVSVELDAQLRPERILVPALLLQPLVENAIRHGIGDRASGGTISIRGHARAGEVELLVEDDGVGPGNSTRGGAGTALANTRRRLELHHGGAARFELTARDGGGARASIRLPLEVDACSAA